MKKERKPFEVYKGLQKPLVFKGIKGKFIYISAGGIIGSFFFSFFMKYLLGAFPSIIIASVLVVGVMFYVNKKEKEEGIYSKDKTFGIVRIKPKHKLKRFEEKQNL